MEEAKAGTGALPKGLKHVQYHSPFVLTMRHIDESNSRKLIYKLKPFKWEGSPRPGASYRAARRNAYLDGRRNERRRHRAWMANAKNLPQASVA